ncbi:protein OPI10 homolog [Liolophura sinensis]|uniref:protein OPI10 homolog n=1 Tax=Liolophura sinensis TaxID=3198878 RepID=UPI0031590520
MFGVIVSGRLVQTEFQQVGETQFLFTIPDADSINHIVVFMTGQTPFPDGLGGAVYFSWPNSKDSSQTWQLLGHITNTKPSAIFKISKLKSGASGSDAAVSNMFNSGIGVQNVNAQIGISVEPLTQLAQQSPDSATAATNTLPMMEEFIQKMVENFVNYASSFCITQADMTPNPSETYVPLSSLSKWFENFKRRLQQNPYFWKS